MSSTFTATQAGLLLVDSGSSKHFIDPGLIRGIESECTTIEPPMEVTEAENDVLLGTAQEILLVVIIRGTDKLLEDSQTAHSTSAWFKEEYIFQFGRSSKGVKPIIEKRRYPLTFEL